MTRIRLLSIVFAFAAFVLHDCVSAQDLHPSRRLSPIGVARTHIGDTYVKLTYGRPYIRNRKIFGANTDSTTFLVPFGQIWRTGASEATELTVTGPIMLGGKHLDPGTYSVYTEPGPDEWVIHISPQLGLDGTGIFNAATGQFTPDVYKPEQDVLSFSAPVGMLPEEGLVDQFTVSFEESDTGLEMVLRWEWTEVRIPVTVH